jgi:hypothetical protein
LKEEFLKELGMSQNQLAHAIGIPGNRIDAVINSTHKSQATPICACASSSACRKATSSGCRTPMTRWKRSAASRAAKIKPYKQGKAA